MYADLNNRMKNDPDSIILAAVLQAAVKGKAITFHWMHRCRKIRIQHEEGTTGIWLSIPRKAYIKYSLGKRKGMKHVR